MSTKKARQPAESEAAFARLAETLSEDPRVDPPEVARAKGFGSKGLKVARKLFAFQSKGRLVVKLSSDRVEALAGSGEGKPFDPGVTGAGSGSSTFPCKGTICTSSSKRRTRCDSRAGCRDSPCASRGG
ncbi:MAG TPA: hypothetical protein VKB92_03305 [Myxococcales bacterium]|nr:hypothetical protein [Myxococcales bacterium]